MTERRTSAAASAVVALTMIGVLFPCAEGKYASLRSVRSVAKLERPVHWVGGAHVHGNRTQDTDVLTGVLSLDGRFGLVVQHQHLPQLAPIKTTFTIAMALFLLHESDHEGYRGIFWKGFGNNHRTPSAWLVPKSNRVTFRVSTTSAREVWGTSAAPLPSRRWCHVAFSLGHDRLMRFYIDGLLDSVVEVVGDPMANTGPLFVGKDMSQPGVRGFITSVQMHAFALEDEDVQHAAASALHAAPDFEGEPEREAVLARDVEKEIDAARGEEFHQLMKALPPITAAAAAATKEEEEEEVAAVGGGVGGGEAEDVEEDDDLPDEFVSGGGGDDVDVDGGDDASSSEVDGTTTTTTATSAAAAAAAAATTTGDTSSSLSSLSSSKNPSSVQELEEEVSDEDADAAAEAEAGDNDNGDSVEGGNGGGGDSTERSSIATSTLVSNREKYANEQYRIAEDVRTCSLTLPEDDAPSQRAAASGLLAARLAYARAAAAGHPEARRTLATMLEGGYGGEAQPGRALYHRLRAAAEGDPGAQLSMGVRHLTAPGADPRAACPVAMYYLYHAATTAYERNAQPGGQARVERLRLFEGVASQRGDHKGESDDRMMYLRQTAELGDWRAMLAMANGYYWGNFGLPRDLGRALDYYQRAHDAGALQGTVGVAKMTLKGEGGVRNLSKALDYYNAAANRSSADALNGLGYMYFYGDPVPKNETQALAYFRRAAALGNSDGIVNTGLMLRAGLGAPRNLTAAHEYFKKCAAMDHASCHYQAALLEAAGEEGIPRDCYLAASRYRRVAEVGTWMSPLADGLKAHLAGNASLARWMYDHAAAMGMPVARFNAAWLHEAHARNVRVSRLGGGGGGVDGGSETPSGFGVDYCGAVDAESRTAAAAAAAEVGGAGDASSPLSETTSSWPSSSPEHPLLASGRRSAVMLRRYAARIAEDPTTTAADLAWAALVRGDCAYYGPDRPGGCPRRSRRLALREYAAAAAAARLAVGRGNVADAGPLLAQALYSEAWMRAHGEGCRVDRRRARVALWEGLAEGGWQSAMAIIPPLTALVAADVVAAASRVLGVAGTGDGGDGGDAMRRRRRRRRGMEREGERFTSEEDEKNRRRDGGSGGGEAGGGGVLRRLSAFSTAFLEGLGRSVFEVFETLETGGGMPHWPLICGAAFTLIDTTAKFVFLWVFILRPAARTLLGLELNPWPVPWGHGEHWVLRDGQWVRHGGLIGYLRDRIMRDVAEGAGAGAGGEALAARAAAGGFGAGAGAGGGLGERNRDGDADDEGEEEDGTDESDASSDAEIEAAWLGRAVGDESRRSGGGEGESGGGEGESGGGEDERLAADAAAPAMWFENPVAAAAAAVASTTASSISAGATEEEEDRRR